MANKKISELPSLTTPASGDQIAVVDVSGTPTTKRVTANNLMTLAPVQSVAGRTGTVTLSNTDISGLGSAATTASTDYATAAQGALADSAQQPPSEGAFVDGDKTKLNGIEAGADITDATNVTAAGALMDSEVTNLAEVKAFDSTDYATAAQGTLATSATQPGDNISTLTNDSNFIDSSGAPVQSVAGRTGTVTLSNTDVSGLGTSATLDVGTSANNVVQLNGSAQLPAVDGSNLTGISSAVDGTAVTSTGETGATKFLREDGDGTCSFQNVVVGDAELRGTPNPHIGAFPNQSLKVIDNPTQSVVVITDSDGNLDFLVKTDASRAYLNTPSSRLELTTGVSVVEDSTEPDIEITTTSGTYSLITGDSDALGANGLPLRQGFNAPDIGANPAPLLISGGTIS